jgi:hypothetical protein
VSRQSAERIGRTYAVVTERSDATSQFTARFGFRVAGVTRVVRTALGFVVAVPAGDDVVVILTTHNVVTCAPLHLVVSGRSANPVCLTVSYQRVGGVRAEEILDAAQDVFPITRGGAGGEVYAYGCFGEEINGRICSQAPVDLVITDRSIDDVATLLSPQDVITGSPYEGVVSNTTEETVRAILSLGEFLVTVEDIVARASKNHIRARAPIKKFEARTPEKPILSLLAGYKIAAAARVEPIGAEVSAHYVGAAVAADVIIPAATDDHIGSLKADNHVRTRSALDLIDTRCADYGRGFPEALWRSNRL